MQVCKFNYLIGTTLFSQNYKQKNDEKIEMLTSGSIIFTTGSLAKFSYKAICE